MIITYTRSSGSLNCESLQVPCRSLSCLQGLLLATCYLLPATCYLLPATCYLRPFWIGFGLGSCIRKFVNKPRPYVCTRFSCSSKVWVDIKNGLPGISVEDMAPKTSLIWALVRVQFDAKTIHGAWT